MAALADGSPAGHSAHSARVVLLVVAGQADGGDGVGHGGRCLELQQADVVLDGEAVVVLVHHDGLDKRSNLSLNLLFMDVKHFYYRPIPTFLHSYTHNILTRSA